MAAPVCLRALVVGSGWAQHGAELFAEHDRTNLVGIVGRGSKRTRDLAEQLGVPAFDDIDEAIRQTRPEIATVAVGERANPAFVRSLLDAGAHVLCSHPVAPDPATVLELARVARGHGLVVATDYSLSMTPEVDHMASALGRLGTPLRAVVQSPGRSMVLALQLCVRLLGSVERVFAEPRYPAPVAGARKSAPGAFPPTLLLTHASGCVSSIVPVPHAAVESAYRITVSSERGRLDAELPGGPVRCTVALGGGGAETSVLSGARTRVSARQLVGGAMRDLVEQFLDAVDHGTAVHAPLEEEAHVRAVWVAARASIEGDRPVAVDA